VSLSDWMKQGQAHLRRLANRADEPVSETMAEKLRTSGARQNPDGSWQTNEGTVVEESPTEAGRREIYAKSAKSRNTYFYKGVRDPATIAMAKQLAGNPDLDIDWGIYAPDHDPKDDPMYGKCDGGPYDGRNTVHHETPMMVAIDALSGRALPGQVGPSPGHEQLIWKAYDWNADLKRWVWDDAVRRTETLSETPKRDRNPQA